IGFIVAMLRLYLKYPSLRKVVSAFFIGCLITGLAQLGIIQYSMKAAGLFDVFFVNSLGLPFFWGFAFYFIAIAALIVWALRFNERNYSRVMLAIWLGAFLVLFGFPFIVGLGGDAIKVLKFLLVAGAGFA